MSSSASSMSLSRFYFQHFHVYVNISSDKKLLDEAYRLRYQVYCREHAFENPEQFSDGREYDADDKRSVHSLLVHSATGAVAGTVRLVLPVRPPPAHGGLPIDRLISDDVRGELDRLPRQTLAEVSRFAVSREFRQRLGDQKTLLGDFLPETIDHSNVHRRRIPNLCLGLIGALVHNSEDLGITHWCAEMEPTLLRMLRTLGIEFQPLGPLIDYHGLRQPCFIHVESMLDRVWAKRPDVYELFLDSAAAEQAL